MANLFKIPWLTESIKKCSIKYLIERYLGHYLSGELDLSQLNVELFSGKGSIDLIPLSVSTINEDIAPFQLPFKLNRGFVQRIEVSVPWSALLTESCTVNLEGIRLHFNKLDKVPNNSPDVTTSSIFSKSLSESSMEMAGDIVESESEKFDGLEKFASLINSVIRRFKLSATGTSIKFSLPQSKREIELVIGTMHCEEEEISLEPTENANGTASFSDVITKRITIGGIELFVNGILVNKINGKHTVKLRFDKDRLDTEVYLGSYIFAILNSEQLKVLRDLFTFDAAPDEKKEKPMTSKDYQHINELFNTPTSRKDFNPMTASMSTRNWTSDGESHYDSSNIQDSGQFKPFTNPKTSKTFGGSSESLQAKLFTCNLKVPGLMLCLISNDGDSESPTFNEMPMIDSLQTFIGINSFLDKMLAQFDHLRVLASNLCVELTNDRLQFSCINVSAYEFHDETLSNILLVKDSDCEQILPSIKMKLSGNSLDIQLASTIAKLDPTIIERHFNIFKVFLPSPKASSSSSSNYTSNGSANSSFVVNVDCRHLEAELFFPIPDLRPNRQELSALHDETLMIALHDLQLRVDGPSISLVCCSADIDMRSNDRSRRIFSCKCDSPDISLNLSFLDSENHEAVDENFLLSQMESMHKSINFFTASTINRNNSNSAFQIKSKLFGEEDNNSGHEQIVTPGDRDHLQKFLNFNKEQAKMCIYINFPQGDLYLENKPLLELLYNRFINDLALWVPYFPKKQSHNNHHHENGQMMMDSASTAIFHSTIDKSFAQESAFANSHFEPPQTGPSFVSQPQFFSFKNPMNDSYDSETSFHSVEEHDSNSEMVRTVVKNFVMKAPANELVLELEIGVLNAKFNTGKNHDNINNLFSQNFLLGLVLGPETDPSTVVCLSMEQLIYQHNDKHILVGNSYMESQGSLLNLALEIRRDSERLKKIKLALQLRKALMLGLDLPVFDELYEFAMLVDDDILGYVCPKVILELHIDIAQSGISFDLLKERTTLVHVEDVYLTSMVIENTAQTILRFLIDEALLCFKRNNVCSETMKSYIPVIDTGIIDLNLKISKNGKLELKVTNNEINIKVCPDSLACLAQFLQLFAAKLAAENDSKTNATQFKTTPIKSEDVFVRKKTFNGSDLIADALFECSDEIVEPVKTPQEQPEKLLVFSDEEDEFGNNSSDSNDPNSLLCQNCDSPKIDQSAFWIPGDDDVGTGINFSKEPKIRQLTNEPLRVIENHFKMSNHNLIPDISPSTMMRYLLDRLSLKFSLFGGRDFDDVPTEDLEEHRSHNKLDVVSQANLSIRSGKSAPKVRFQQNSVVWENIDLMSHHGAIHRDIYSTQNGITREPILHFKASGGTNRKNDICVELKLNRIKTLFENFDPQHSIAWRFMFFVQEIQILDKVNASKIKTILYEYVSETIPRRKNSNMFAVRMTCHRNFMDKNEECNLNVSLKPLRINVDQDTLMFLIEFIAHTNEILTAKLEATCSESAGSSLSGKGSSNADTMSMMNEEVHNMSTGALLEDALEEESDMYSNVDFDLSKSPPSTFSLDTGRTRHASTSSTTSTSEKIFIKSFVFAPDVQIRLDYHGKHIDLTQGALPGIFLGLAQLNQSELRLKRLVNKHGLLGLDKVIAYAVDEWTKDIRRNQLPSILGGVGPMHSFIQLFQGIRDLFWMPIDQYRKDQRIVRGLQRGAHAFTVSTAMATLELTNRFVSLIQTTAQFAHDVVTPPAPSGAYRSVGGQLSTFHNSQPRDFREGVTVAYTVMREGLQDTVRGVTNAGLVSDDMSTVIGEVVRQIPSTLVRPFIHVSQATSSMLVGMRNQLTPEARKDDHEKWKNANER